ADPAARARDRAHREHLRRIRIALEAFELVELEGVGRVRRVAVPTLDHATGTGVEVVGEPVVAERAEDAEEGALHGRQPMGASTGSGSGAGGSVGGSIGGGWAGGGASGGGSSSSRTRWPPYQAAMLTAPSP